MKFTNKIALVTGATSGIGQVVTLALAREGAIVYFTGRDKKRFSEISEKLTKIKAKALGNFTDLDSVSEINLLVKKIKNFRRRVDIIVNAAAIWHTENKVLADIDYKNFTEEEIVATMNVGILAPMLLVNKLLPLMKNGGKIVNISGTFENGAKGWIPYFVSKQALEKFTIGLAEELRDNNIQVNCVSPSDTLTPAYKKFFPEDANPENCVTPEEVTSKVLEFCDFSSKITGQIVVVKK